ncbi:Nitrogen assimilation transcription factor nit-4 [Pseudocercospora fuligena]|uniref:Nitrogen assimilation transcription factor nit-4 n=1 Tax=Pseudocercospora fuligena TaxID=685502 RepID=A0A8H6VI28_9PEZI|nr:Nitrogen assimilation transcription factor nit-4 [Pseudocercospora fuligena]
MEAPVKGAIDVEGPTVGSASMSSQGQRPEASETKISSPSGERSGGKKIVDVACWPCRKRKGKCSGDRPVCASCIRRGVECSYEYDEGLTRVGSLRLKLHQSTSRAENLEYLYEQLRTRSDDEAALLLAIVRLGADIDKMVMQLKSAPDLSWAKGMNPPDISKLLGSDYDSVAPSPAESSTLM